MVDNFADSFCYRTHSDNYAFCIFCTVVIEQTILAACDFGNLVHVFLNDSRNCFIVVVARFTVLEEVVRIFGHTTGNRVHRVQCTCAEFSQSFLVDKRSEVFVLQHFNLLDFVDEDAGFMSSKSYQGRDLKALELPGLWNGSMSDWNTCFVEVPLDTFNPVKVVLDLLRPAHQG